MKRLVIISVLLGAMPFISEANAAPQKDIRKETIVRTDTVTHIDTIITTKKIKRTEYIERIEEVFYSDSVVNSVPVAISRKELGSPVITERVTMPSMQENSVVQPASTDSLSVSTPASEDDGTGKGAELSDIFWEGGGKYLWIPDSLTQVVSRLLNGERAALTFNNEAGLKSDDEVPGDDELVTFRGDTVNMVLRDRNLGRYDRGLLNYLFIPKGIWSIGLTASYGEFSTEDLEVLDLMSDIDFSGHIFSIRPYFSYFIGNNRSIGMRLGYTSGKAKIGSFKVDIDDDMNFNLHDISYRSESYTAAITYNQYFGIVRRGRFGIFNEVELAFSSGNSDFVRPFAGVLKTTHTNTMQVALNFSPGLCIYIMDPVSFNVSFGVFGVSLRNDKQIVDGVDMGNRFTSAANFRFNIFNISFGVAVNL